MTPEEKELLQASLKSMDTEEWLDLKFYRPLGFRWALLFKRLGVSPNSITIASIFLGVMAGVLFYFDSLPLNILGMFFLVWANTYDSADGQLARLTGQTSELGRMLDGISGDLWFIAIYMAICLRLHAEWSIWIWLLAAVAGYGHSKQAAMADYYRNIHLYFLKGKQGSEHDTTEQESQVYKTLSWRRNFLKKLFTFLYIDYTKNQEKLTPHFQAFAHKLLGKYTDGMIPQTLRDQFCKKSLPLMKYTNILSLNTRVIVLFISLFISMPWIYFLFEIVVLNSLLIYMVARHERLSKEMTDLIDRLE